MREILILLILVFFVTGCGVTGPSAKISEEEVYTGQEGLYLEFRDNAPPEEVYDGENFPILIDFDNRGAFDIIDGSLILRTYDNFVLESSPKKTFKLKGRSIERNVGDKEVIKFRAQAQIFPDTEVMSKTITAIASYDYETNAMTNICIDTDPFNELEITGVEKACSLGEVELTDGQGAPVAVTKIIPFMDEESNEIKPRFKIFIENIGDGELASIDGRPNIVSIADAKIYDDSLACDEYEIDLNKKDNVICRFKNSISKSQNTYVSLISIKLRYNYKNTINKDIMIKNKKI